MKVLYVGPYFFDPVLDIDTVYNVFFDLYTAIEKDVEKIYLLTSKKNSNLIEELEKIYKKLSIIKVETKSSSRFNVLPFILEGAKVVKKEKINVITNIAGGVKYGFDALLIRWLTGGRLVVRISGNELQTQYFAGKYNGIGKIFFPLDKLREWCSVKFADSVIAMAPWEAKRLDKIGKTKNIHVCFRGIDVEKFKGKQRLRMADEPMKVLFVGRKSLEKGYDLAIEVARQFKGHPKIHFIFAGDFEKKREENIEFLGYVHPQEMPKLYQDVDIVLMPSRTEGLPQVLLEAMSMQKACIVPKHLFDGFIEDGKTALLCNLDIEEIARKIVCLSENPHFAMEIGRNARTFVESFFSKENMGIRYKQLLLENH